MFITVEEYSLILKELAKKGENFEHYLQKLKAKLSYKQLNTLIYYHNQASDSQPYGQKMVEYLISSGFTVKFITKMYILSIDWPKDIKIEMMHEW